MKQIFAFAILLIASLIVNAEKVKIGDLYYILDETNKTAEVASKYNYTPSYSDYVSGDLIIPSSIEVNGSEYTITSIGGQAFYKCNGLTSVTIPNSVTTIGGSAFYDCSGLVSLTIPNSVTSIGGAAFSGCSGLVSVTIPNSVTTISSYAFSGCSSLVSLTIPNSVTTIGTYAFYGCSSLVSVTIPNSVTTIDKDALSNTSIRKAIWLCNTPPSGANNVGATINYVSNNQFGFYNQRIYPFLSSKFEVDNVVYVPVSPSERTCDVIDCNYSTTSKPIKVDSIVTNRNIRLNVLNINPYAFYGNDSITEVSINNKGAIGGGH